MAHPNRTVAAWRNSKPALTVEMEIKVPNSFKGEIVADQIRGLKVFKRVTNTSVKVGPRNANQRDFTVRCFGPITDESWRSNVIRWNVSN